MSQAPTTTVRAPRQDKGKKRLTERDLVLLAWIGEQYAVRFDTLQTLISRLPDKRRRKGAEPTGVVSERNVRRVIKRWGDAGLAQYQKLLYDEPGWVWLTSYGLSSLGMAYRPYTPTAGSLNHFHMVNVLRLRLEERYGNRLIWKGERKLRREVEELTDAEKKSYHLADAEATVTTEDGETSVVAIEVELTQKSAGRLKQIISALQNQYAGVWYFVNDITEVPVRNAIGSDEKTFRVYRLDVVVGDG